MTTFTRSAIETLGSTVIQTPPRHGKTAALRDLATREGLELRAELEALRAERDALREGAKRVADLLEENGCDCDCECDSDGHDDDCDPCLACRIDAAIRRVHMWTHVDDLPVCSRCGVVRRAGGETVCRGRTPTIATREGQDSAGARCRIDGELHRIPSPVSHERIAELAGETGTVSIVYSQGPMGASGVLAPGQSVAVCDGMRFSTSRTGAA